MTVDHETNHSTTAPSALRTAAATPTPEVIPHPALDLPVDSEAQATHRGLDKVVFGVTAAIAVAFLTWGFVSTSSLADLSATGLKWIMLNTGWLFVLTASAFVVFVIWLALGRYGNIPLGRDDERPEFRTVSWVAMMFSAGMGIGLMFYGVGEPLAHFTSPPPGTVRSEERRVGAEGRCRDDAECNGE